MTRKKQKQEPVEIWVEIPFVVNDLITCRLRGDVARPDSCLMTLMYEGDQDSDPIVMRIDGLSILENYASYINEFLQRMKSAGTH